MHSGDHEIEVGDIRIAEGTSLYDTKYDRVLWISNIDDTGVTVEPVTDYEVDKPTGWPPGDQTHLIADGTVFSVHDLTSLIDDGRFEVSP